MKANARLIAAAPELLEIVRAYAETGPDFDLFEKAKAAITKAEGR